MLCPNNVRSYIDIYNCNDLTFQGITWIGCGEYSLATNKAHGVMTARSSSIFTQKNTFKYSLGPALDLTDTSFTINNCDFMNSNYRGHGAAININDLPSDYVGTIIHFDELTGIINNCDFNNNKGVESLVYLRYTVNMSMCFNNTTFYNNQGVSIYLSSHHHMQKFPDT